MTWLLLSILVGGCSSTTSKINPSAKLAEAPYPIKSSIENPNQGRLNDYHVVIIPTEDFSSDFADKIAKRLEQATGLRVMTTVGMGLANIAPLPGKLQYVSETIIETATPVAVRLRSAYGDAVVVVLTNVDLVSKIGQHRFHFGMIERNSRVGVISAYRMIPGQTGSVASAERIEERVFKFCLRYVGEAHYRLGRSTDIETIMYSPIMSLEDLDAMGTKLPIPNQ